MRHDRRRSPGLEPLEAKQLLSTLHAHAAHVTRTNLPLDGVLSENFTANSIYYSGQAGAMGQVVGSHSGIGHLVGRGSAAGTFVLDNTQGSVRLSLVVGFKPNVDPNTEIMTSHGSYRITSGTGAYRSAAGSGTIEMVVDMNTQDANAYEGQILFHSKPA